MLMLKKDSKFITIISALLVMLLWGSLFPFVKIGYKVFDLDSSFIPNLMLFAGIRFAFSGLIISGFMSIKNRSFSLNKKELLSVLLVGAFAIVLHYICTYAGLSFAESSSTALLKQLGAFLFIPFSFFLRMINFQ